MNFHRKKGLEISGLPFDTVLSQHIGGYWGKAHDSWSGVVGRILTLPPNQKPLGARRLRRISAASHKINRFVRLHLDIEAT